MIQSPNTWLMVVLLVASGCQRPQLVDDVPIPRAVTSLTGAGARELAERLADQKGENLQDYERPKVHFDSTAREWVLLYELKPPGVPGGHFVVRVNDRTGKAEYFPGE